MAKIICVSNQKGGVGKSTTAAALGDLLADAGYKALLIDLDPQSSLSNMLGVDGLGASMADVIGGAKRGNKSIKQITRQIKPGLDLAPASIDLSSCELGLVSRIGRESVLRQSLQGLPYDVILIDCPPSLSLLTVNALTAADLVIVPSLPSAPDIHGISLFLDTLETIRDINPGLQLMGVLVVQYDPRLIMHAQALEAIKADLQVIGIIPRSVKAQEAAAAKQPITSYDPAGKVSQAYSEFVKGVIQWLRNQS